MSRPLAIDLYCGLGGWTEGLLAEGYDVVGFDIEQHVYGAHRYPAQLVIQDVLTLHGSQLRDAALIIASPPCQEFSYMAMPWKIGKAKAAAIRADMTGEKLSALNRLFDACFRIQREACEAADRHIPLIVENVRGAQRWVGRARWNFGSFYLWGDVPALMPFTFSALKKDSGCSWFNIAHNTASGKGNNPDGRKRTTADIRASLGLADGIKQGGSWFDDDNSISRQSSSKSPRRKAASAMIAKIPLPLSRWIAATFHPRQSERTAA